MFDSFYLDSNLYDTKDITSKQVQVTCILPSEKYTTKDSNITILPLAKYVSVTSDVVTSFNINIYLNANLKLRYAKYTQKDLVLEVPTEKYIPILKQVSTPYDLSTSISVQVVTPWLRGLPVRTFTTSAVGRVYKVKG